MMLLRAAHCRLYGRLALSAGGDETYGCGMLLLDKRCECSQATHIRYVPVHLALIGASRFPLAMMRRYGSGGGSARKQYAVWYGEAGLRACAWSSFGNRAMAGDNADGAHLFVVVGAEAIATLEGGFR